MPSSDTLMTNMYRNRAFPIQQFIAVTDSNKKYNINIIKFTKFMFVK